MCHPNAKRTVPEFSCATRTQKGPCQAPNGGRLSCAAVQWFSQMQFYYDGRRQLQPLVRLRTENRRSDPASYRNLGEHSLRPSLHRSSDAWWNDARIHRRTPAPAPDETSIRKAHRGTRTHPSDAAAGWKLTRWGSQQNAVAVCLDAQPNGSRLSCGALKKDSFNNLRAPPASSAC